MRSKKHDSYAKLFISTAYGQFAKAKTMTDTKAKTETKNWKSAIIPYVELKLGGGTVEGVIVGEKVVGERSNSETGEVRDRLMLFMHKAGDSEAKFQINLTAGLKNALANADVKPGDLVKIVRLDKIELPGKKGQSVNQYDILIAS